jgi:hypothetical protein
MGIPDILVVHNSNNLIYIYLVKLNALMAGFRKSALISVKNEYG